MDITNIEKMLRSSIANAFVSCFGKKIPPEEIKIQPTRKEFQGTHTFVVFPYSRLSGKSPEETGKMIGNFLKDTSGEIDNYNVVKGFLNLEINDKSWMKVFDGCCRDKTWGKWPQNGKRVMIEYSSPNTNKPLHLGHLRNNFLGYAIACILEAVGFEVRKVNLVNDRGIHICKSMLAYVKFGKGETPESSGIKGDHLIGKYYVKFDKEYKKQIDELISSGITKDQATQEAPLIREAREMLKRWEEKDPETIALWTKMNQWVYDGFDQTYREIGVDFDTIYHESETYIEGKKVVEEGLQNGIFVKKDDGSVWVNLEHEGLDEKLLLRSDGTSVYITQDLGTADIKFKDFPFDKSIYVVGNEQDYHFDLLVSILKKLDRPYADRIFHLSYGMVDLPSGKMKSREGTVVDADDLIADMRETAKIQTEELGKIEEFTQDQARELYSVLAMGALKYFLLKIDPKKRMLFNPEESIQFQGHTGPFIQYTHARIASILRKADELRIDIIGSHIDLAWKLHETEKELIIQIAGYPETIVTASEELAPSTIAGYCFELAKSYNRFYTEVSIFNEKNEQRRNFRVALSARTARNLKLGMGLLGIEVPDRM